MPAIRLHSFLVVAGMALCCAGTLAVSSRAAATELPRGAVLTEVRTAFANGDRIGSLHEGADCRANSDREWSPLVQRRIQTEVSHVFRDELAKAQPVGAATKGAPLKVQAFLNDIHVDLCQAAAGAWQGGFYVQVGWQIVSPQTGKVVYQASTDGSFTLASPQRITSASALREALGVAVRNLLGDRRFAAMLEQNGDRRLALATPL